MSISLNEFHDEVLFLDCAFVAYVGLGEEHLEGTLFSLAHHAVLDLFEGRGLAIDFGKTEFARILSRDADLIAFFFLVDINGRLSAVFRFRCDFDVLYFIEGEASDEAAAAFGAEVIDVLLN